MTRREARPCLPRTFRVCAPARNATMQRHCDAIPKYDVNPASLLYFATGRVWRAERYRLLVGFGSHPRSDGGRRLQVACGAATERHQTVVLRGVSLLPSRQRHRTVRRFHNRLLNKALDLSYETKNYTIKMNVDVDKHRSA